MKTFEARPEAENCRRSLTSLVKVLLANRKPDVLLAHYRAVIDTLLWKFTEADGKFNTRFRTQGAMKCDDKRKLRHEHVYQRRKMIDELVKAKPEEVDSILKRAIGCTITDDEHDRLKSFDYEYGWKRYQKARLVVIDRKSGKKLKLSK
jgi:hypothetical protein